MENPDRPEKFTYEGHAGYWIFIHTLRSAIKSQVDHMNSVARKEEES